MVFGKPRKENRSTGKKFVQEKLKYSLCNVIRRFVLSNVVIKNVNRQVSKLLKELKFDKFDGIRSWLMLPQLF